MSQKFGSFSSFCFSFWLLFQMLCLQVRNTFFAKSSLLLRWSLVFFSWFIDLFFSKTSGWLMSWSLLLFCISHLYHGEFSQLCCASVYISLYFIEFSWNISFTFLFRHFLDSYLWAVLLVHYCVPLQESCPLTSPLPSTVGVCAWDRYGMCTNIIRSFFVIREFLPKMWLTVLVCVLC